MEIQLNKLKEKILSDLEKVTDSSAWRDLEIKYLGRKGELTKILRSVADLGEAEKKNIGKLANNIKTEIVAKFAAVKNIILEKSVNQSFIDATLPGQEIDRGHLHPITQVQNELEDLFTSMGFMVIGGPELESDYYNFEALNIPKYHPARDMQDTFYIDQKNKAGEYDLVMRCHTSPVQIRAMQKYGAPLRCIAPGRAFRSEATDACHDHTFYQLEGLMIDKDISIANLIAIIKELLNGIFKKEIEIRIRPGYFPFVEPGIELDIKCTICNGKKCPACKNSGWLELLPAGLVHPNVLKAGGIDSKKYSGFAFGLGLTRLAMMKYGINDIRLFNSGDLRFLEQF
ncbi:phenylalanine--tRNA ligase subunit alpha [Patescibacteria group bacterium]|nr:phenylalanine--tRNA ligase subunit alpha [Patescibacteria group bacterium]MBU1663078.1 phenylalanine--tRNA ligase subunit alpha [Patescibacteria group bacterium]MBU1934242.1 phenylalanine--tRNA ligase subunit alpha [Patescibacteria group bacterium]MBU2008173.1 phenylalanine--tRNA ligase subunit alpha [Patescibacteria group bacterium]MBU2233264.1 phenylalanine--tRNA ligase subunit alpha [Patescibacteria group bacterium]